VGESIGLGQLKVPGWLPLLCLSSCCQSPNAANCSRARIVAPSADASLSVYVLQAYELPPDQVMSGTPVHVSERLRELTGKSPWVESFPEYAGEGSYLQALQSARGTLEHVRPQLVRLSHDYQQFKQTVPKWPNAATESERASLVKVLADNEDVWTSCFFGQVGRDEIRPRVDEIEPIESNTIDVEVDDDGDYSLSAQKATFRLAWSPYGERGDRVEQAAWQTMDGVVRGSPAGMSFVHEATGLCIGGLKNTRELIDAIDEELNARKTTERKIVVMNPFDTAAAVVSVKLEPASGEQVGTVVLGEEDAQAEGSSEPTVGSRAVVLPANTISQLTVRSPGAPEPVKVRVRLLSPTEAGGKLVEILAEAL